MQTAMAALFFLRYWRLGRDRLFLFFSLAFCAMTLNWIGLSTVEPARELIHYVYFLRLLAFVLIIIGIIDKNRRAANRTVKKSYTS
jgi:hypothetical protein